MDALLRRRGWSLGPGTPHAEVLGRALDALSCLDHPADDELLDAYADAATTIAEREVGGIVDDDPVVAAEHVVVGTLLLEPVLLSIRRIAQENVSRRTRG